MNTLKPLLVVAVLAGIGYGVYVRINSGNDAPPPDVAEGWDSAPKVQLPQNPTPVGPDWGPGGGPGGGVAPGFVGSRQPAPAATAPPASEAPPFQPAVPGAPVSPPQSVPPSGPLASAPQTAPAEQNMAGAGPVELKPAQPVRNPYVQSPGDPGAVPANPQDVAVAPPGGYERAPLDPQAAGVPQAPGAADGASFATLLDTAQRDLEAGQLAVALERLSAWYNDPRLAPAESQRLNQLLDQIAGTVVYSTQHWLEPPYEVQPGEHLEDIAQRYNVPWQLLAKINGIDDPQSLRAGERLKVIRGPFSALVSLDKRQMTLLLNGSYAGRFAIGVGTEHPPQEGTFAVSDKVINPVYHGRDRAVGADDPNNPLGERWIGLGSELGIHGTDRPENIGRNDLNGSISLSPHDVEDVYDILSIGSKVTIRR